MCRREVGQATIEWSALVLLVALVLGVLGYVATRTDARRLGDAIIDTIACAVGGCSNSLEDVYGKDLARAVRHYAPNIVYERRSVQLPVDFRRCRELACSNGTTRSEMVTKSDAGLPVTAFTRVVDRRRQGGSLYLQYWLYFPESFTGGVGRKLGPLSHRWPGYHRDDWEGYQVRIAPGGRTSARATAHGRYKSFKDSEGWGPSTGWYRVSGGSHAGHLVSQPARERTTSSTALTLVPLEGLSASEFDRFEVTPPWAKGVYQDPESPGS